jgi:1-acyl-sn-glycerol-3-phosphate acyltransferase
VLLEREGELGLLPAEDVERTETEAPERVLKALRTDRHDFPLRGRGSLSFVIVASSALKVSGMRLADLGVQKLWNEDPEVVWPHGLRFGVAVGILGYLARGSRGYGIDRVPLQGGFVLAANHFASLDHPLIGIFSPRAVFYMAKKELLDMPYIGELLAWTGAFPVKRGLADREALREARRLVREGHVVGVHIEGTRQKLGYPGEVKIGGMMIAMQEGVPVVPCAVETFKWNSKTNRRSCAVVWGDPIATDGYSRDRPGYDALTELVTAEILRLWRLACEAVAAGYPRELSDGTKRFRPCVLPFVTDGVPVPG